MRIVKQIELIGWLVGFVFVLSMGILGFAMGYSAGEYHASEELLGMTELSGGRVLTPEVALEYLEHIQYVLCSAMFWAVIAIGSLFAQKPRKDESVWILMFLSALIILLSDVIVIVAESSNFWRENYSADSFLGKCSSMVGAWAYLIQIVFGFAFFRYVLYCRKCCALISHRDGGTVAHRFHIEFDSQT